MDLLVLGVTPKSDYHAQPIPKELFFIPTLLSAANSPSLVNQLSPL
jgi:hypothetical protein